MTRPRSEQVIPGQPGFYHCISRCVRRSWLCGFDPQTGRDFSHRRDWIVERMRLLTTCFAIDVYAYAVMSNHTHIVLHVDPTRNSNLSNEDVIQRWKLLWNWRHPERPLKIPTRVPDETVNIWRARLGDVSWFMRMLNEPLARIANAEDGCKGHFWESRFKSLPLLDEAAVIACMAYVDLNPIKAGVAETIDDSNYTSIQHRVRSLFLDESELSKAVGPVFEKKSAKPHRSYDRLSVTTKSYVDLIQQTADGLKQKSIHLSNPTLNALGLSSSGWLTSAKEFVSMFKSVAGGYEAYEQHAHKSNCLRRTDSSGRRLLYKT